MLDVMGEGLDGVMHWGEGCPCHWVERPLKGPSRHRFKTRRQEDPCPLSSMRAPELASGALENVLARIWDVAHSFLLLRSSVLNLCDEERTKVVQEFSRARKHVMFYFMVKTGVWKVLPWALFSLSDHREAVSRQGAKRCLSLYAAAEAENKNHALVVAFCQPGEPGTAELERYARGESLLALPKLEVLVAKTRFAMVVERWIESRHAWVGRIFRGAPHASALHVGFHLLMPTIRSMLKDGGQDALLSLSAHCQESRSAAKALARCGLEEHPVIASLKAGLKTTAEL